MNIKLIILKIRIYQNKIVTISIGNINYTINLYNDVNKFVKEIIK